MGPPGRRWSPGPGGWPCRSSRSTVRWSSGSTGAGSSGCSGSVHEATGRRPSEQRALPGLWNRGPAPGGDAVGGPHRLPQLSRPRPPGEGRRDGLDGELGPSRQLPRLRRGGSPAGGCAGRGPLRALRSPIPAHVGLRRLRGGAARRQPRLIPPADTAELERRSGLGNRDGGRRVLRMGAGRAGGHGIATPIATHASAPVSLCPPPMCGASEAAACTRLVPSC
jgi:hypothetical protein